MIKELGGMRNEVEKKKWARVADAINIPKMVPYDILKSNENVTKLTRMKYSFIACLNMKPV